MNRNRLVSVASLLSVVGLAASPFESRRNMLVNSPIFNEISGKLGGAVGMTSRFGMQLRGNVTPNNPDTGPQFIVRNNLSSLSAAWAQQLTAIERGSWSSLSEDTPGSADGKSLFIKSNSLRVRMNDLAIPRIDTAPASISADFSQTPTVLNLKTDGTGSSARTLGFTLPANADFLDSWAKTTGGAIGYYVSKPQKPTRLTKIKPNVFIGYLKGNTTSGSRPGGAHNISLAADLFNESFAGADTGDVSYVTFQCTDHLGAVTAKFETRVVWEDLS